VVFNPGPYTVLPDNSILITANMQSETGFPSSHQLKSYVASKFRLKLAARAVLSADTGLLVLSRRQRTACSTVQLLQRSQLIQHLSENVIMFPHVTRQCRSRSYLRWHIKAPLIVYFVGNISAKKY